MTYSLTKLLWKNLKQNALTKFTVPAHLRHKSEIRISKEAPRTETNATWVNPKFEARNPKQTEAKINSKSENPKQ
jgi:hypothetical protein